MLWRAETQAPNTAYTERYRANSFKPGDEVTVTMRAAASGGPFGLLAQVVLADGTKFGSLEAVAAAVQTRSKSATRSLQTLALTFAMPRQETAGHGQVSH